MFEARQVLSQFSKVNIIDSITTIPMRVGCTMRTYFSKLYPKDCKKMSFESAWPNLVIPLLVISFDLWIKMSILLVNNQVYKPRFKRRCLSRFSFEIRDWKLLKNFSYKLTPLRNIRSSSKQIRIEPFPKKPLS